jgi:hypothetical protein
MTTKQVQTTAVDSDFVALLADVKIRIQSAQSRAVLAANAELIRLYWDIGRIIGERQRREGWGAAVIPRLAAELKNELPDLKGFSERNIKRMLAFHREYPDPSALPLQASASRPASPGAGQLAIHPSPTSKVPQVAAQIADSLLWGIPWFHHIILAVGVDQCINRRFPVLDRLICRSKGHFIDTSLRYVDGNDIFCSA